MSEDKIPGVDIDAGLELYGGEMDIFITVLNSFAENTPTIIDKLRNVSMESLPDYLINIHGLKSVSATIAATEINEKAKALEMMAKEGNLSGVLAENSELLNNTENLINTITNWLKTANTDE